MPRTHETILVVDDQPAALELLRRHLEGAGYQVHAAAGVEAAVRLLQQAPVELVLTDLRMPERDGLELLRYVRENLAGVEVVLVTGYATIEGAVEALRRGAADYLVKPYTEEELLKVVRRVLAKLRRRSGARPGTEAPSFPGLIGHSPAMRTLYGQIGRAAAASATVLVSGESGTGKELVARAIHDASPRRRGPFVPVNCGAIPESLLESELFGHVRGAFTGADRNRVGLFQAADRGTVFLDEISETTPATQLKLLRVLQEREISPVGASLPRRVDVRVVAATNRDLAELVRRDLFRQDLFYRIHVLHLEVPPLRERGEDVLLLAAHFAEKFAAELGRSPLRFTDAALQRLLQYPWPGNVRELQNVVQRLAVMSEGESIDLPELPAFMRVGFVPHTGGQRLEELEAEHIRSVLESVRGNKVQAARILGIDRKTLYQKIRRYQLGGTAGAAAGQRRP